MQSQAYERLEMYNQEGEKMKPWRFWGKPKTMAVAMIVLVGAAGFGVTRASQAIFSGSTHATLKLANPNEGPSKTGFAPIVKSVLPDVVNISTSKLVRARSQMPEGMQMDPFFRQFFGNGFNNNDNDEDNRAPNRGTQREE